MRSNRIKLPLLRTLALSLVLWGCDVMGEPAQRLLGPEAPSYSQTTTAAKVKALKGKTDEKTRYAEMVIDHKGGSLGVAGNKVTVPQGAVSEPTLFTIKLGEADSLGYTKQQVELRAFVKDDKGKYKVDVGPNGFLKPVKLRLTYDWITDPISDVEDLRIAWVKNADGDAEIYATNVDPSGRTVHAFLDHFSDYALALP